MEPPEPPDTWFMSVQRCAIQFFAKDMRSYVLLGVGVVSLSFPALRGSGAWVDFDERISDVSLGQNQLAFLDFCLGRGGQHLCGGC